MHLLFTMLKQQLCSEEKKHGNDVMFKEAVSISKILLMPIPKKLPIPILINQHIPTLYKDRCQKNTKRQEGSCTRYLLIWKNIWSCPKRSDLVGTEKGVIEKEVLTIIEMYKIFQHQCKLMVKDQKNLK